MALKIDENQMMTTAHHVNDGAKQMYLVDARMAVAQHPDEWSHQPWAPEDASAARQRLHERRVAQAKAVGDPEPEPPVEPELDEEDRRQFEEWKANRDKAAEIVAAAEKEQAEKDAKAAEIATAKAIVETPPPQPDPLRRRPLAGAAKANAERTAQRRADEDRTRADERAADDRPLPAQPAGAYGTSGRRPDGT